MKKYRRFFIKTLFNLGILSLIPIKFIIGKVEIADVLVDKPGLRILFPFFTVTSKYSEKVAAG